jgi:hypothetical protein
MDFVDGRYAVAVSIANSPKAFEIAGCLRKPLTSDADDEILHGILEKDADGNPENRDEDCSYDCCHGESIGAQPNENKMSDGHRERVWVAVEASKPLEMGTRGGWPFAPSLG